VPRERERLVRCKGDGNRVGWVRVPDPPPLEIERDGRLFVLDDSHDDEPVYITVPSR
jgi:hypothetical protein